MQLKSLRVQYSIPIIIVTVVIIITYLAQSYLLTRKDALIQKYDEVYTPALSLALNADRDIYQAYIAQYEMLNNYTALSLKKYNDNADQVLERVNKFKETMSFSSDVIRSVSGFDVAYTNWRRSSSRFIEVAESSTNLNQKMEALSRVEGDFSSVREILDDAGEAVEVNEATTVVAVNNQIDAIAIILKMIILASIAVSLVITYLSPKRFSKDLYLLAEHINTIAKGEGDLTKRLSLDQNVELSTVSKNFNALMESLASLIRTIQNESETLKMNISSLDDTTDKTKETMKAQQDLVSNVVYSVSELSQASEEISVVAVNSATTATDSKNAASEGKVQLSNAVVGIKSVNESVENAHDMMGVLVGDSNEIASVIDVIRGIAEQTNLLALNAAIEAARAGEQGRGFAVVADEVRTLATRTQESTNSIQEMIEKLQGGVGNVSASINSGAEETKKVVELVSHVEVLFGNLLSIADDVTGYSQQTAAATEEQTQVSKTITHSLQELQLSSANNQQATDKTIDIAKHVEKSAEVVYSLVSQFKT